MKIRWSPTAISDLESIRSYIAKDNPAAARKISGKIIEAVHRLNGFPLSGRAGRVPQTRELIIAGTPYIVVYIDEPHEILIAAVLHGRQKWPQSL